MTIARYRRSIEWAANCFARPSWATSVLATTRSPDVSLSIRCTIPGRATPPIPERLPPQWCSKAFTKVPSRFPAAGWTTRPAGLSTTSRCSSSKTIVSGMSCGSLWAGVGSGTSTRTFSSPRTLVAGSRKVSRTLDSPAPNEGLQSFARDGRGGVRKRTVEAPARMGGLQANIDRLTTPHGNNMVRNGRGSIPPNVNDLLTLIAFKLLAMQTVPMNAVDLASLLCSRLCHDLMSPVGALNNGIELLADEQDPDMREKCLELLEDSARASANKLKFFRLAFGAAGGFGEEIDTHEAEAALEGVFGPERRIELGWVVSTGKLPKGAVKLLLNLALLAGDALVRGGRLDVGAENRDGEVELVIRAEGPRILLDPALRETLDKGWIGKLDRPRAAGACWLIAWPRRRVERSSFRTRQVRCC